MTARLTSVVFAAALLAVQCKREPSAEGQTAAPASASAQPVASAQPEKPKPWYEGRWSGTYDAALRRIELEVGGVRAWKDDDGKLASGAGTITVSVDPEGVASGESDGPLGALTVSGTADDERLRLTLSPKSDDPKAFRGTLIAQRADQKLAGTLNASSGDSLTVREAKVELRPADAAP